MNLSWFKTRMSNQFASPRQKYLSSENAAATAAHNAGADSDPWQTGNMSWERSGNVTNDKYFK